MIRIFTVLVTILLIGYGCAKNTDGTWKAPLVYRVDIQQGNVVNQDMINKLKPGMDQKKVRFIMGTPLLVDPFHSDRWEYLFSMEPGKGERRQRHITLHFRNEKLFKITGDVETSYAAFDTEDNQGDRTVVVPLKEHKEGFFSKFWEKVTPEDDAEKDEEVDISVSSDEEILDESVEDTALVNDAQESETAIDNETEDVTESGSISKTEPEETVPEIVKPEEKKKKGLVGRFWDRITKSEEDSTDDIEETERDKRDAEMLEEAGESL